MMKSLALFISPIAGLILASCSSPASKTEPGGFSAVQDRIVIGNRKAVTLKQPQPEAAVASKPQIIEADILPGRGMNIYQLRAYLPGKGVVNLIESPSLDEAKQMLNGGPGDEYGNASFKAGGAILVPFANRIRGKLEADGKTLETTILGKPMKLIANWKGKNPGAEPHAMHGLILNKSMDAVKTDTGADHASVTGTLAAGDFDGHWLSKTDLSITATLKQNAFVLDVTAKNAGTEDLPAGVGWHPYFTFPSGDRTQARLHIPAKERALVDNYDNVFPTGQIVPVAGTPYDFTAPGGAPLKQLFLDDCFVNLERDPQGHVVAEIIDPKMRYGLRITGMSSQISAFQAYAPVNKAFVAFEPQFNWADPFSPIWKGRSTGMVILKPGESVTYTVQLEPFIP